MDDWQLEQLTTTLNLIGEVEAGQTVALRAGRASVMRHESWSLVSLWRRLVGESREQLVEDLRDTSSRARVALDSILSRIQTFGRTSLDDAWKEVARLCMQYNTVVVAIVNALAGIENLCVTYSNDRVTVVRLNGVRDNLNHCCRLQWNTFLANPLVTEFYQRSGGLPSDPMQPRSNGGNGGSSGQQVQAFPTTYPTTYLVAAGQTQQPADTSHSQPPPQPPPPPPADAHPSGGKGSKKVV